MDLPTAELETVTEVSAPEEVQSEEEKLPKIDISFTNVASDAE